MYFTRPSPLRRPPLRSTPEEVVYYEEDKPVVFEPVVFSEDEAPVDTGLVDANGHRVYRTDREPIGFLRF